MKLHEVTPRDGLQNEKSILTIQQRQELIQKLSRVNPSGIELTSFVRGDRVPTLAGASELCERLKSDEEFLNFKSKGGYAAALVPNMKGLEEVSKSVYSFSTILKSHDYSL